MPVLFLYKVRKILSGKSHLLFRLYASNGLQMQSDHPLNYWRSNTQYHWLFPAGYQAAQLNAHLSSTGYKLRSLQRLFALLPIKQPASPLYTVK